MKKTVCSIAIIAAFCISSSSYAQKLMLGPRVGVNIATVAWDSAAPSWIAKGSRIGLIGGGQLDVWFSDRIALSTGLLWDQKGWHEEYGDPLPGSYDFTLNYLELPVFLKVAFDAGSVQPYLFAGPSVGLMLLGHVTAHGTNEYVLNIKDQVNTVDFSIVGGAGVAFNLSSGTQIFVDAGYAYGLVNIAKGKNQVDYELVPYMDPSQSVGAFKTRDIRIAAGVLFPM